MSRAAVLAIAMTVLARHETADASATGRAWAGPADPPRQSPVIIYGVPWCGACRQAGAYVRGKGIPCVELDVQTDSAAAREMQSKLSKDGLKPTSIPVIDVHGKVVVGFNAQEIDRALRP